MVDGQDRTTFLGLQPSKICSLDQAELANLSITFT